MCSEQPRTGRSSPPPPGVCRPPAGTPNRWAGGRSPSPWRGRSFREQYRDLVAALIADQNRAGIDILVDGDARFDDDVAGRQWIAYPEDRLAGLGPPELRS